MKRCAHCFDVIPKGRAVNLKEQEWQLQFCCRGCLAVYQFLQENPQEQSSRTASNLLVTGAEVDIEQQERAAFGKLVLALILFVQLGLILLLQTFSDVLRLSHSTQNTLQWAVYPYFIALLFVAMPALLKPLKSLRLQSASYSALLLLGLVLFIMAMAYSSLIGQSKELMFAASAIFVLLLVSLHYYEVSLYRRLLDLQPLLLVQRAAIWINYFSACLLLVLVAVFLYRLPQDSLLPAWYVLLLSLLIVNPSGLKILAPSALYFAYRALSKQKIIVRSASVLEQLARLDTVLLSEQSRLLLLQNPRLSAFFSRQIIELKTLDTSSARAAELQLRLLQQQNHTVLLCVEDELGDDLLWQADVSLSVQEQRHNSLSADLLVSNLSDLTDAITIARRYWRNLWLGGLALLVFQMLLGGLALWFGKLSLLLAMLVLLLSVLAIPLFSCLWQKTERGRYE